MINDGISIVSPDFAIGICTAGTKNSRPTYCGTANKAGITTNFGDSNVLTHINVLTQVVEFNKPRYPPIRFLLVHHIAEEVLIPVTGRLIVDGLILELRIARGHKEQDGTLTQH